MTVDSDIDAQLCLFQQHQLLDYRNSLMSEKDEETLRQLDSALSSFDLKNATSLFSLASTTIPVSKDITEIPKEFVCDSRNWKPSVRSEHWNDGLSLIKKGKIGVITLAGGQGTRLGTALPKGMYDIGLESKKSLFQLQAERMKKLNDLAEEGGLFWAIMTSRSTHSETSAFLEKCAYFGLDRNKIDLFVQGELPCFSISGSLLMKSSTEVVEKSIPEESVGILAINNQKITVVEYSELSGEASRQRKEDGTLVFRLANIANHYFSLSFLIRATEMVRSNPSVLLPHLARKKIAYFDPVKRTSQCPESPNGYKLERFIFDIFGAVDDFGEIGVMLVDRGCEFSPLKNAPGCPDGDCPETCRAAINQMGEKMLRDAGYRGSVHPNIEISPLVSYTGEDLPDLSSIVSIDRNYISEKYQLFGE